MALSKFSTQAPADLLNELKALAKAEGKQFQSLVIEAFRDLIEKLKQAKPRPQVMQAFDESLAEYDTVFETLAK